MQVLNRLFGRRRRYDDLSVSIQEHIEERTEELVEEGMPRTQAEQTARREFGNVTLIQEHSREAWQWPALESILTDLKFAFRRLRKSPDSPSPCFSPSPSESAPTQPSSASSTVCF